MKREDSPLLGYLFWLYLKIVQFVLIAAAVLVPSYKIYRMF
jgi:hypothetical protein